MIWIILATICILSAITSLLFICICLIPEIEAIITKISKYLKK